MGDIITDREKFKRGWVGGGSETPCGSGSKMENTVKQREWLPLMVEKYGIKSIADIGAGDLNWIKHIDWDVKYTPYDLVPRHESVTEFDIVNEVAPEADALLCLWVLNHLPYEQCEVALENLVNSGSRYLIMTDRPIWHDEQPPQIQMPYLEELTLNKKGDRILLCEL